MKILTKNFKIEVNIVYNLPDMDFYNIRICWQVKTNHLNNFFEKQEA